MKYLEEKIQDRIEEKLEELNKLRPLPVVAVKKLKEQFQIEMTYNSNGIEGNSLTLGKLFWLSMKELLLKENH